MIYLLIVAIVGAALAVILDRRYRYDGLQVISAVLGLVCGVGFVIGCFALLINSNQFVREFKSAEQTIKESSRGMLENAAITIKIIEYNQELNDWKYWNDKWHTGFLITDDVETLESIK